MIYQFISDIIDIISPKTIFTALKIICLSISKIFVSTNQGSLLRCS